jgi:hypothetical protein
LQSGGCSSKNKSDVAFGDLHTLVTHFGEHFQRMNDMGLRVALKKSFVTALAETGCRVHNQVGVGRKWDCAVASEIE